MNKLLQLAKKNLTVLLNAGSIVGTTAVTSLLGFAYWWVAARFFSTNAIGLASAMVSVMSLLGTISMLGLGTLLTGELARQPGKEWALINAALIVTGGAGVIAGVIFALLAPLISPDLDDIGQTMLSIALFAFGVGFTTLTMVLDQALIGILRGGLQLWRNTLFSAVKLILLVASFFLFPGTALLIYATWLLGNVLSLVVLLAQRSKKALYQTSGDFSATGSHSLTLSGPLNLSGPLSNIERTIKLPCPDCGVLSSNSASFCLNCGYPFSPTVEMTSVRPQLLFDYGMIGLSETVVLRKRKNAFGNVCPECGAATLDNSVYCASCGYALTPTIEIPSVLHNPSRQDIETTDTIPLLSAIKRENAQQTLSAESTMLFPAAVKNMHTSTALKQAPRPLEDEATVNLPDLPRTPLEIESEKTHNLLDLKRSALFIENEKTMDLPHLPGTPLPEGASGTREEVQTPAQQNEKHSVMPQWRLLRKLGGAAIQHHIVNLILLAPSQLLPILVTILLSATETAYFYVSFMLANFIFSLTYSLTAVLHAVSSAQPSILAQKIRFTLSLSFLASIGANLVLQIGADLLLESFGHTYAGQAAWCLRILSLAVFPIIVKSHYLAICRVYDRTKYIILPIAIGSTMELGAAAFGAHIAGLMGLSLGWLAALLIESFYMARTVYKAANPVNVNTMASKKPAKA